MTTWLVHSTLMDQEAIGVWHEEQSVYLPGIDEDHVARATIDITSFRDHVTWEEIVDYLIRMTPSGRFWGSYTAPDDLTGAEVLELVRSIR